MTPTYRKIRSDRERLRYQQQTPEWRKARCERQKLWREKNKTIVVFRRKQRWDANKNDPALKARRNAYHKRMYPQNRLRILAQTKAYALAHPEVSRKAHRNWCKNHPEKYRAHNRAKNVKRRAALRGGAAEDRNVGAIIRGWMMQPIFRCEYCHTVFPVAQLTVDHRIPIARGGKHVSDNVCPACLSCNSSKGDKLPSEFSSTPEIT